MQADIDLNESDADATIAALQADVDGNESDSDSADTTMQADIDLNESDADAAIAALQADIDSNETESNTADTTMQADVDQNEADADAAIAALQVDVDQNEADSDTADTALQANIDAINIFSEFNSIYLGSDPSATTVTNGTPSAKNNISMGKLTMSVVTTGDKNTAIGHAALKILTTGDKNNVIGYQAGTKMTTGHSNDILGFQAGTKITTGLENVMIGKQAGFKLTTGKWNVFLGKSAGTVITTGQQNTIIGNGANVGSGNVNAQNRTTIGAGAVNSNNNTVVLGNANVTEVWMAQDKGATVHAAGYVGDLTGNVTGNVTGGLTGDVTGNVTGDVTGNVTGNITGNAASASALSVAIGLNDLSDASFYGNGYNNIGIGSLYESDFLADYGYYNTTIIGSGAGVGGYANSVVLGNSSVSRVFAASDGGAEIYASAINTGSDRRFKTNIRTLDNNLEKILQIRAKQYTNLLNGRSEFGVIAQEIKEIFPELVQELDYSENDELDSKGKKRFFVNYQGFIPILINAVKEQQEMIKELLSKVDEIEVLKQEIQMIKDMMNN